MRLSGNCRLVGNLSISSHSTSRTPSRCAGDFCETARDRGSLLPFEESDRMAGDSESALPPPAEDRSIAADAGFTAGFGRVCRRASGGGDIRWDGDQTENGSEGTEGVGRKRPPDEDVGVPRTVLYREVSFRAGAPVELILRSGFHPQRGGNRIRHRHQVPRARARTRGRTLRLVDKRRSVRRSPLTDQRTKGILSVPA